MAINVLVNGETHNVYRGVKLPLADGSGCAFYNYAYCTANFITPVNALVGTGTQWIDTELKMTYPSSGYELKIVFALTDVSKNALIMGENSISSNQVAFTGTGITYSRGGVSTIVKDTKYTYWEINGKYDCSGNTGNVSNSLLDISPMYTTGLFAKKTSTVDVETNSIAKMKLYEFSYSEGGEEKIHLVPALDGNGVAGLCDTVSRRMFYSQTDAFEYE